MYPPGKPHRSAQTENTTFMQVETASVALSCFPHRLSRLKEDALVRSTAMYISVDAVSVSV